ncbi:MAG: hypothetical protein QXN59_01925 [Candidatus Micrarchaeaceae archaeon]
MQQGYAAFNQTLNATISQLNLLNESSYLIFYPSTSNITSEIAHAKKIYMENPSEAYALLASAQTQISEQKARLSSYKYASLVVSIAITAFFGYTLYYIMKPVRKPNRAYSRRPTKKR